MPSVWMKKERERGEGGEIGKELYSSCGSHMDMPISTAQQTQRSHGVNHLQPLVQAGEKYTESSLGGKGKEVRIC